MSGQPNILEIRKTVISRLDDFVKWPKEALLLWHGCVRTKYHTYPSSILTLLAERDIYRRNWSNDPAIHAFLVAGGERPTRCHKNYGWDIHHLYLGFPNGLGRNGTHAVKEGLHFTQSAGLVAVHPIANALYEEDPEFAELLRKESFNRFGYDPDGIFSSAPHDGFGFVPPHKTRTIYIPTNG
jgi:hypothetical protein